MNISINAYWFYGYKIYDLGSYKVINSVSKFYLLDKEYEAAWLASFELGELLRTEAKNLSTYMTPDEIFSASLGSEYVVGIKQEVEIDYLVELPNMKCYESTLKECLTKLGFQNLPDPKLYLIVTTGQE